MDNSDHYGESSDRVLIKNSFDVMTLDQFLVMVKAVSRQLGDRHGVGSSGKVAQDFVVTALDKKGLCPSYGRYGEGFYFTTSVGELALVLSKIGLGRPPSYWLSHKVYSYIDDTDGLFSGMLTDTMKPIVLMTNEIVMIGASDALSKMKFTNLHFILGGGMSHIDLTRSTMLTAVELYMLTSDIRSNRVVLGDGASIVGSVYTAPAEVGVFNTENKSLRESLGVPADPFLSILGDATTFSGLFPGYSAVSEGNMSVMRDPNEVFVRSVVAVSDPETDMMSEYKRIRGLISHGEIKKPDVVGKLERPHFTGNVTGTEIQVVGTGLTKFFGSFLRARNEIASFRQDAGDMGMSIEGMLERCLGLGSLMIAKWFEGHDVTGTYEWSLVDLRSAIETGNSSPAIEDVLKTWLPLLRTRYDLEGSEQKMIEAIHKLWPNEEIPKACTFSSLLGLKLNRRKQYVQHWMGFPETNNQLEWTVSDITQALDKGVISRAQKEVVKDIFNADAPYIWSDRGKNAKDSVERLVAHMDLFHRSHVLGYTYIPNDSRSLFKSTTGLTSVDKIIISITPQIMGLLFGRAPLNFQVASSGRDKHMPYTMSLQDGGVLYVDYPFMSRCYSEYVLNVISGSVRPTRLAVVEGPPTKLSDTCLDVLSHTCGSYEEAEKLSDMEKNKVLSLVTRQALTLPPAAMKKILRDILSQHWIARTNTYCNGRIPTLLCTSPQTVPFFSGSSYSAAANENIMQTFQAYFLGGEYPTDLSNLAAFIPRDGIRESLGYIEGSTTRFDEIISSYAISIMPIFEESTVGEVSASQLLRAQIRHSLREGTRGDANSQKKVDSIIHKIGSWSQGQMDDITDVVLLLTTGPKMIQGERLVGMTQAPYFKGLFKPSVEIGCNYIKGPGSTSKPPASRIAIPGIDEFVHKETSGILFAPKFGRKKDRS